MQSLTRLLSVTRGDDSIVAAYPPVVVPEPAPTGTAAVESRMKER